VTQTVGQSLTTEARIRYQAMTCEIFDVQSGFRTGFSPSTVDHECFVLSLILTSTVVRGRSDRSMGNLEERNDISGVFFLFWGGGGVLLDRKLVLRCFSLKTFK